MSSEKTISEMSSKKSNSEMSSKKMGSKKILLTGGGTAGHVTPNLALIPDLVKANYRIIYVGSKNGMEKELVKDNTGIAAYYGISSGKLRRYLDLKNVTDIFRVVKGLGQAVGIMRKEKPDIVFSKGGFVIVPVVIAAKICRIPVVIHESDISPGLANKISLPFANAVCVSFPDTIGKLPEGKAVLTGAPIRRELSHGDKQRGLSLCGFETVKPIVLFVGGSSGSLKINACLRQCLPVLLKAYNIVHLCGAGNVDASVNYAGYRQYEYVTGELPDLLAAADIVVSRAGANSIFELLMLRKPHLLIPLSRAASRGDQLANAEAFEALGYSKVLREEEMNESSLASAINGLYGSRESYVRKMSTSELRDGIKSIVDIIIKYSKD